MPPASRIVSAPSRRPIVFDASRLVWRLWRRRLPTGIDRVCLAYLQEFADRSLAMLQWGNRRIVLGHTASDALFALLIEGGATGLSRGKLIRLLAFAISQALALRLDLQERIYLNVGHTGLHVDDLPDWLSRQGLAPVHLVHDLIPITHPRFCRVGEADKHAQRMRNALRGARGIIVNSSDTGHHLEAFARRQNLPMPPLLVAHLGIEPMAPRINSKAHDRPYFLSIGTIEGRKNHMLLLRTWERLRQKIGAMTPDLVLIGQRGWEAQDVFAMLDAPFEGHGSIIELGHCSDGELAAWIDNACAVLMPSRVEGYGLPVLEAMSRGTPVIASNLPVYREIAGGIPLLLDPDDELAWAAAIEEYLAGGPDAVRQRSALRGYSPPSWRAHMAIVEPWLMDLARH